MTEVAVSQPSNILWSLQKIVQTETPKAFNRNTDEMWLEGGTKKKMVGQFTYGYNFDSERNQRQIHWLAFSIINLKSF